MDKQIEEGKFLFSGSAIVSRCPCCESSYTAIYTDSDPEEIEIYTCDKCGKEFKIILPDYEI